jgi:hypothetical protein
MCRTDCLRVLVMCKNLLTARLVLIFVWGFPTKILYAFLVPYIVVICLSYSVLDLITLPLKFSVTYSLNLS